MALLGVLVSATKYGYLTVQVRGKAAQFQAIAGATSDSFRVALSVSADMSSPFYSAVSNVAAAANEALRVTVRGLTIGQVYYYQPQVSETTVADSEIQSFKCGALDNETFKVALPSDVHANGYQTDDKGSWYYDRFSAGTARDSFMAELSACVHPITGRGAHVDFDASDEWSDGGVTKTCYDYTPTECVGYGIKTGAPHFIQYMGDDVFFPHTHTTGRELTIAKNFALATQYFGQSQHFLAGGHEQDTPGETVQEYVWDALKTYRLDPENGVECRYGYYDVGSVRFICLTPYAYTTVWIEEQGWSTDNGYLFTLGATQAAWFAEALKGDQKLNIVCTHLVLSSVPSGGDFKPFTGINSGAVDVTHLYNNGSEMYNAMVACGKECVVVMGHNHNYCREISQDGFYVFHCPAPYNQRTSTSTYGLSEHAPHYGGDTNTVRGTLFFEIDQTLMTLKSWVVLNDGTVSPDIPVSTIKLKNGGSMG